MLIRFIGYMAINYSALEVTRDVELEFSQEAMPALGRTRIVGIKDGLVTYAGVHRNR